jgi:hypothetical protein
MSDAFFDKGIITVHYDDVKPTGISIKASDIPRNSAFIGTIGSYVHKLFIVSHDKLIFLAAPADTWTITPELIINDYLPVNIVVTLSQDDEDADICGLCGEPGADKIPHPMYWPGERRPGSEYVHASCEQEECSRAHSVLSDKQRREVLSSIR